MTVRALDPPAMIAIDLWGGFDAAIARLNAALDGDLPPLLRTSQLASGWRAMRVEPTVWWLIGPLEALGQRLTAAEAAVAMDGATADLSGAFARLELAGAPWRALLMVGGVFDAENPAFGPGSTAGTSLHHVGVRYDVIDDRCVHIFVEPSYAADLLESLRIVAGRLEI